MTDRPNPRVERLFSERLERELLEHPDKWVAIVDDLIVAVANTPSEALDAARQAGHEDVLFHHVPSDRTVYVL
ncbi:MAG: DUF5678 domain-containing protein [Actinomycetota bacterium]